MSINAELVAKDVLNAVKNRERINMYKIAIRNGYKPSTARNPTDITEQDDYKAIMIPALKRMETIRDKVLIALNDKDMSLEDSRVLKELLDSTTKNIQLLSGKATENTATTVNVINYYEAPPVLVHEDTHIIEDVKNTETQSVNGTIDIE